MRRQALASALIFALVIACSTGFAQDASRRQRIIKVSTLNSVTANQEFNRNVQVMKAQRQLLIQKNNLMKAEPAGDTKDTLAVELEDLEAKINDNNQKMFKTYGFSLTRDYTLVPEVSHVYMQVDEAEAEKYAADSNQDIPDAEEGQQRLIRVSSLNSVDANQEFNKNVNIVRAQRRLAAAKYKEQQEGTGDIVAVDAALKEILANLDENNKKMFKTYGFSITRNYTMVIEKSSVYMWVTEDEFEKFQAAQN
jgi:hypothetical protein